MPDSPSDMRLMMDPEVLERNKKAALRNMMRPGDYLMQDAEGEWKIVRGMNRDKDASILNTVGKFADKYLGFGDDRRRSRLISGVASQWYGLDEGGNPAFGETPGIVHETKALGALPTMLGRAGMDWYFRNLGEKFGAGDLTQDPMYQMVQKAVLSDPEWAVEAAEKADAIHKAVREDMGLKAPQGFEENAQEAFGVMLGQLPIPGKVATKGAEAAAAAPSVLKRAAQGAEWFTPTVRPSVGNYATGTGVGATLGTLADGAEEDIETILPDPEQKGMYHVRPTYSDGSVGFSGHPDDEEALKLLLAEEAEREGHADGGRVGTLDKLIQKYLRDNTEGTYIGNSKRYLDLVRRHVRSVPDNEETELLEDYVEAPWGWSKGDRANLYKLVDRHAVELDPDVQLHRGVSAANPETFDPDWSPGVEVKHTDLPVIPTTTSRGMAYDFATMIGDSPNNAILNFNRKGPFRAMPIPQSGQDEWLLLPGQSVVRDRKHIPGPLKGYDEILEVDVDFNQYPTVIKYEDGGSAKDLCSGGMATVKSMRAKYGKGGKVRNISALLKRNKKIAALRAQGPRPLKMFAVGPEGEKKFVGHAFTRDAAVERYGEDYATGEWPEGHKAHLLDPDSGEEEVLDHIAEFGAPSAADFKGLGYKDVPVDVGMEIKVGTPWEQLYSVMRKETLPRQMRIKAIATLLEDMGIEPTDLDRQLDEWVQMDKTDNFGDGGQVKDYCSGGMATVRSMKAKYAEGGKVNSALKAIRDAIAHLDNNDTASAMRTLQANPDALRDPGIAEALRKLRHPTTAKQGRRALDAAATADVERAKVSTFAKGGKVNNARRTAAAVLRYMRSIDSNMSYDAYDDLDKLAKKAKKSPAQLDSVLQEAYGNLTRDASKSEIRSEVKKVVERGVGPNPSFGRGAGRMKPQGSTKKG